MRADTSTGAGAEKIAEALLHFLRQSLDQPGLQYGSRLRRISGGNESDIYSFQLRDAPEPFGQRLVARVFGAGSPPDRARHEAAVHRAVNDQGLAAPRVFLVGEELGHTARPFLIMEYVPGRSGVELLLRPSPLLLRLPSLHAETMVALHRLDAGVLLDAVEAAGLDRRKTILDLGQETRERKAAREFQALESLGDWLDSHAPEPGSPKITHGDLHPLNLMIHRSRVSAVLDWTRAVVAPAEYDIAANRVIAGFGPVVGQGPWKPVLTLYRRWFLRRFERLYRSMLPVDESLVRFFEVQRALGVFTAVATLRKAGASGTAMPFDQEKSAQALDGPNLPRLAAHVEQLSGVRVELCPRLS